MEVDRYEFELEIAKFMGQPIAYIYGILSVVMCVAIQDKYHGVGHYIRNISSDGLISLGKYGGGGWMTKWPISSKEYRAKTPTKADVRYIKTKSHYGSTHIAFLFSDDGGQPCAVVRKYAFTNGAPDTSLMLRLVEEIDREGGG